MSVGDLLEVLIFVALLALAALFGGKKKARRPDRVVRGDRARPTPHPAPRRAAPRRVPSYAEPLDSRTVAEQILEQFRAAIEPPEPPESVADDEAASVETLEPAGGASHERFHDRYVAATPTPPPTVTETRRRPLVLRPTTLQQAVIWREVLGRPKGLE